MPCEDKSVGCTVWVYRVNVALALGTTNSDPCKHRRFYTHQQEITTMSATPNSSKILGLWRRSPRSSDATPTPARTPPVPGDLDMISAPSPRDGGVFQSTKVDAKLGALETSIAMFREAATLASSIPYMGAVAGIFVQIITIRGVSVFFLACPRALLLSCCCCCC